MTANGGPIDFEVQIGLHEDLDFGRSIRLWMVEPVTLCIQLCQHYQFFGLGTGNCQVWHWKWAAHDFYTVPCAKSDIFTSKRHHICCNICGPAKQQTSRSFDGLYATSLQLRSGLTLSSEALGDHLLTVLCRSV